MAKKILVTLVVALMGLGFMIQAAAAGGWPPGTKFAHAECAIHPKLRAVPVLCKSHEDSVPFRKLVGRGTVDFDWIIEVNDLPAGTTMDSMAEAKKAYAIRIRKPRIAQMLR